MNNPNEYQEDPGIFDSADLGEGELDFDEAAWDKGEKREKGVDAYDIEMHHGARAASAGGGGEKEDLFDKGIEKLLEMIDRDLERMNVREMAPAGEVVDMLLDLRLKVLALQHN